MTVCPERGIISSLRACSNFDFVRSLVQSGYHRPSSEVSSCKPLFVFSVMMDGVRRSSRAKTAPSRFWRQTFQEGVYDAFERLEKGSRFPEAEREYAENGEQLFLQAVREELARRDSGGAHRSVALPVRGSSSLAPPAQLDKRKRTLGNITFLPYAFQLSIPTPTATVRPVSALSTRVQRAVRGSFRKTSRAAGQRQPERRGKSRTRGFARE